jgi:hypothetical protein
VKRWSLGKEGASRSFFGVEAALVEEVAKRRLAGKRRLAASDPGCGAEADDEPKRAVKRWQKAAQFFLAAQRRRRHWRHRRRRRRSEDWRRNRCCSEAGVVAEAGVGAKGCGNEAGLESKRMLLLKY